MTEPPETRLEWRVGALETRMQALEDLKPEVLADRVDRLATEVGGLRKAFLTFAFSVVGSAILFAFTTFALLGKH